MRKSNLPLKKLHAFVSHFLKRVSPNKQAKKKGRPQKYEDALIITLWLFQILNNYSYRETLEKAKDEGFNVPSLCDYHYRVKQLDDELLKSILEECAKLLLEDKQILCYIADATDFGFGDKSPTPSFKTYFKSLELYRQNPNLFTGVPKPPKPKKLSKLTNYSIELDKYCSLSFARLERENLVGINLSDGMIYVYVDKEQVKKLTDIDKLYSARLVYDNGSLYLQISYLKELKKVETEQLKYAGIDIGVGNLMAVFIDDETMLRH
jgi:transposase